jgi:hypothetical protein
VQFLFAITLFVSAFLLFLVQPLVGKLLLPKLGGTPAVWNACLVFFQAMLLAGYGFAHAATAQLGSRRQAILQLVILALPAFVLPITIGSNAFRGASAVEHPVLVILVQLAIAVGLPFFVVSTTSPLLQRWFADTGHTSARDPYFLYAASNLGSMLALIAYPVLVEPEFSLPDQSRIWALGYAVYAVLVVACAVALWRGRHDAPLGVTAKQPPTPPPSWPRRLRWVLLAFVPSSFLLGTTTYISTDIAPIPLLWVIPLALYLLSFIVVFAKKPAVSHALAGRLLPIAGLMLTLVLLTGATELRGLPVSVLISLHLGTFYLAALVAHGELARDRPATDHLTEFYLWMSVGGVLGGAFNALLAPIIFQRTGLAEYPLVIVLACMIRPACALANSQAKAPAPASAPVGGRFSPWTVILPAGIGALTVGLVYLTAWLRMELSPLRTGVMFGLPCVLVYTLVDRPVRYGLGLAALLLAGIVNPDQSLRHLERNFFGVLKVAEAHDSQRGRFRILYHGNTIHGQQSLDNLDADGRHEPLTYYHRTGPIGHLFEEWLDVQPAGRRVAAVGLGTGSLAWYARAGDDWTFYEIDPAIQRIAEDPAYFNFLSECRTDQRRIVLGDARLKLEEAADHSFDLIVLDAFSSDSIPMHLITAEALALYQQKLASGGIIAFHVSNRYLRLQPIVGKLAEQARLAARGWDDLTEDKTAGKLPSQWLILAERDADFGKLVWPHGANHLADARWEQLRPEARTPLWTDAFSNLLSAFDSGR